MAQCKCAPSHLFLNIDTCRVERAVVDVLAVIDRADAPRKSISEGRVHVRLDALALVQIVEVDASGVWGALVQFWLLAFVDSAVRETVTARTGWVQVTETVGTCAPGNGWGFRLVGLVL